MGYQDLTAAFEYKKPLFRSQVDQLGENDLYLSEQGWETSVRVVFYQAAAPTGWTKITTQNDKMLRVVSGAGGGSGGSQALSTTITRAHTHSIPTEAAHTHGVVNHSHAMSYVTDEGGTRQQYAKHAGDTKSRWISGSAGTANVWAPGFANETGTLTPGTSDAHDHGGVTDSQVANIALAYVDVIVCSKDSSSGYTDLTDEFDHNQKADFDPFDVLADNDEFNRLRLTEAGTVSIFYQAAAPTGWTQVVTQNDKALRIVSGTGGGSGGTDGLTTDLMPNHSHAGLTTQPDHSHSIPNHSHNVNETSRTDGSGADQGYLVKDGSTIRRTTSSAVNRDVLKGRTAVDGSGTTTSSGSHTHTISTSSTTVKYAYVDVIQCSKDSHASAPDAYNNMTAAFSLKKLISKQRLRKLAANDENIKWNQPVAGTVMYFFQAAAPLNWTKSTDQNDKALRIVSGAGGSAGGGSLGASSAIPIAHTHQINSGGSHSHSYAHTHAWDAAAEANAGNFDASWHLYWNPFEAWLAWVNPSSTSGPDRKLTGDIESGTVLLGTQGHSHGGTTGSGGTNVTLAYIDVIACAKD